MHAVDQGMALGRLRGRRPQGSNVFKTVAGAAPLPSPLGAYRGFESGISLAVRAGVSGIGIEAVGWLSSALLVATLVHQVRKQWKSGHSEGVSRWLFIGQLAASVGFVVYSALLKN